MRLHYSLIASLVIFISSCNFFKKDTKEVEQKPIAKVNDIILYDSDLEGLMPSGLSKEDSINFIKRFAEQWVKKEVLFSRAITQLSTKENDEIEQSIEEKVKEYKYSLYTYEFEKAFVEEKLDTVISDKEIEEYYKKNPSNFALKQNIVRCIYLKIPVDAPKLDKVKSWMQSAKGKNLNDLKSYSMQYASEYNLETDKWIDFDQIINSSPLKDLPNRNEFLSKNKYYESKDENYLYLFNLIEYKISNQVSPLEFVKKRVKDVLLNQRKRKLIAELEQSIFDKAKEEKEFEIYL